MAIKPEIFFGLENAGWPALLVEQTGRIQRANQLAIQSLAGEIKEASSHLSTVWSPENTSTVSDFLETAEYSMSNSSLLRFTTKSGGATTFLTYVAQLTIGEQKFFVLQLFKPPTSAGAAVTAAPAKPAAEASHGLDASLAHKQKLDCALQLARTVSLDFNNALTSILGHASLLLSKAEGEHPWRNSLVEIEKSAAKAAEIASDLANFSRQEKDKSAQQAGNLNTVLQRCVDAFKIPENAHIEWQFKPERKLFAATFDEAKLQQALIKIMENSVQAIRQSGCITLQTRNMEVAELFEDRTVKLGPGNYVCVEITDNGCGIAPDALPRIFEPFFTTKGAGYRGLGLAWVYGIVTNHGGGVAISSQPNVGTSARVYLPATKRYVKDSSADTSDLCGVETVLMVDDEDLLLNMGQMVLSSFGYRALIANSGQKALEILEQDIVDVVVTDLVMPNMSGRELIERIRKVAPTIRIICSSGYIRAENQEEEEFYLQKPFTAQELLQKVRDALNTPESA